MTYKFEIKSEEIINSDEVKKIIVDSLRKEMDYKNDSIIKRIVKEQVGELVMQIATKEFKNEIKDCVKNIIKTFERTDLTYRDEYRKLLIDCAGKYEGLIMEKVKATIETEDSRDLYNSIGDNIAGKFYNFIKNED